MELEDKLFFEKQDEIPLIAFFARRTLMKRGIGIQDYKKENGQLNGRFKTWGIA
ncbi:hypothetical protein [Serratia sp. M24T3]|uniref:hypothetical protein n=1 Tax=Serratia sp. M24T3 TaxID=932213 RepID=UPI0002ED3E29|nr:hypothetical protein [Serratia sp. M24T3]